MGWGTRTIQGTQYTLQHLDAFTFIENGLRIRVQIGAHAFTRQWKPADHPDLCFMDGKTRRTFCATRYGHSLHLPAAIIAAAKGYVFHNQSKFAFKATLPGITGPYVIAFELRRSNSPKYDVKLLVVSAHHRRKAARMPRCAFHAALAAVVAQGPVPWEKK
jgi:hypothetical protein